MSIVLLGLWALRTRLAGRLGPPMQPFGDNPLLGADFWVARATAVKVIGQDLWLLLWPRWLSCDYSYDQIPFVTWTASAAENGKGLKPGVGTGWPSATTSKAVGLDRFRSLRIQTPTEADGRYDTS